MPSTPAMASLVSRCANFFKSHKKLGIVQALDLVNQIHARRIDEMREDDRKKFLKKLAQLADYNCPTPSFEPYNRRFLFFQYIKTEIALNYDMKILEQFLAKVEPQIIIENYKAEKTIQATDKETIENSINEGAHMQLNQYHTIINHRNWLKKQHDLSSKDLNSDLKLTLDTAYAFLDPELQDKWSKDQSDIILSQLITVGLDAKMSIIRRSSSFIDSRFDVVKERMMLLVLQSGNKRFFEEWRHYFQPTLNKLCELDPYELSLDILHCRILSLMEFHGWNWLGLEEE